MRTVRRTRGRLTAALVAVASFAAVLAFEEVPASGQDAGSERVEELRIDHELPEQVASAGRTSAPSARATPDSEGPDAGRLGSILPDGYDVDGASDRVDAKRWADTASDADAASVASEGFTQSTASRSRSGQLFDPEPVPTERVSTYSRETIDEDGKIELEVFDEPAFRQEPDGSWKELSPRTTRTPGGAAASAMLAPVRFGDEPTDLLSVATGDGSVSLDAIGLDIRRPDVAENQITYRDVADGVDLVYTTSNATVTKELRLERADVRRSYTFRLSGLDGYRAPEQLEDGAWVFRSKAAGGVSFMLPPALAWDSKDGDAAVPSPTGVANLKLTPSRGDYLVTVSIDGTWLKSPSRRFPVTLDPSIVIWPGNGYPGGGPVVDGYKGKCFAPASCSLSNFGDLYLGAGTYYDTPTATDRVVRSYTLYDLKQGTADETYLPDRANISAASYWLYFESCLGYDTLPGSGYSDHCLDLNPDDTYTMRVDRMFQSWTTGQSFDTLANKATFSGVSDVVTSGRNNWIIWNITSLVQSWVNFNASGYQPNYGMQIREVFDGTKKRGGPVMSSTRYTPQSGDNGGVNTRPLFAVNYTETTPGVPTNVTASPNVVNGQPTTTANLTWTRPTTGTEPKLYYVDLYDADVAHPGGYIGTYSVNARPCGDNGWNGSAMVNTACQGTQTFTATGLTPGQTYRFRVRANNSGGTSAQSSTAPTATMWLPATLNLTQPASNTIVGDQSTWTLHVGNPNDRPFNVSAAVAVPPGMVSVPGTGRIDGVNCGAVPTLNDLSNGKCWWDVPAQGIWGGLLPIGANASRTLAFDLITIDGSIGCQARTIDTAAFSNVGHVSAASFNTTASQTCSSGLGFEPWWSTVERSTGPNGKASVNVASGNLVAQHLDSTPVQGNGQLAYVLRRTYNSQAPLTIPLSGMNLGQRWNLNVAAAGDLVSGGITADGIIVPVDQSTSTITPINIGNLPLTAVTLIDRDGTRHAFKPRTTAITTPLVSAGLDLGEILEPDPDQGILEGLLAELTGSTVPGLLGSLESTLQSAIDGNLLNDLSDLNLCLSTSYEAPPGVHLSLWRYVVVDPAGAGSNACTPAQGTAPVVVGYATMRPDRAQQVFDITGRLVSMYDRAGNELRYSYGVNGLAAVWEPTTCDTPVEALIGLLPLPGDCRSLRFTYNGGDIQVTDPAGRTVVYDRTGVVPNDRLAEVRTYDDDPLTGQLLERWVYRYKGDTGTDTCTAPSGVLCDVVPPRYADTTSNYTRFAYGTVGGKSRVTRITERAGGAAATTFNYFNAGTATAYTDAIRDGRAQRFKNIDTYGRVDQLEEGTVPAPGGVMTALRTTNYVWDETNDTCTVRVDKFDHNLCALGRLAGPTPPGLGAPAGWAQATDRATLTSYTPTGDIAAQATGWFGVDFRWTTYGYATNYHLPNGTTVTQTDTPSGAGAVASPGGAPPVPLYYTVDRTQILGPRGNVAGLTAPQVDSFRSTYEIDNNPAAPVGTVGTGLDCGDGNSGLVCAENAPEGLTTRNTFDAQGRKLSTQEPTAEAGFTDGGSCAAVLTGALPCSTVYVYEAPGSTDITGNTDAEGWLRAVVDPYGEYVAFAHDRAGNVVRSWDRDATATWRAANGNPGPDTFPTDGTPLPDGFAEARMATGTFADAAAHPWRYVRHSTNPVGDVTTYGVDAHGNTTRTTPPRGVLAGNSDYDTTTSYDANDRPTATRAPLNTTDTTWTYDGNGNVTVVTDPRGNHIVTNFDAVNRPVETLRTRGPWDDQASPATCVESSTIANRGPIPTGLALCRSTTTFDGHDQTIRTVDAAGGTVYTRFNQYGHGTNTFTLRTADDPGTPGTDESIWLEAEMVFDVADNATSVCGPRQHAEEPAAACAPATAHYSTHTSFDPANRPVSVTAYREVVDAAGVKQPGQWETLLSTTSFQTAAATVTAVDRRGNTTVSYRDLNGRLTRVDTPHDADPTTSDDDTIVTTTSYSPSGDVTTVDTRFAGAANPTSLNAYRYDAAHRIVDTVEAATSPTAAAENGPVSVGGDNPANVRTRVLYDPDGNPAAIYEPRSFATSTTNPDERFLTRHDYDEQGRRIATWAPYWDDADHEPVNLSFEDDECPTIGGTHTPAAVPDVPAYPAGVGVCVERITEFDPNGNPLTALNPTATNPSNADRYTTFTWTHDNLLETVEAPDPAGAGRVTVEAYRYDAAGRGTRMTDAEGWSTQTTYSPDGLAIATQEPAGVAPASAEHRTTTSHNAAGQPISQVAIAGAGQADSITNTSYYADGLTHQLVTPVTGHNAGNLTTRYAYDAAGNPTKTWSPSAVAQAANNPTGAPTLNTFADSGLLQSMVEPVDTTTDLRRGTTYVYDAVGRKLSQHTAEITGADPFNPGSVVRDAGTQTFTWSPNGWSLTETGRNAETIAKTYEPNGLIATVVDSANQATVTNTWMLNGWMRTTSTEVNEAPAYETETTAFKHHADGIEAARSIGTDPTGATADQVTSFVYGNARTLTDVFATGWGRSNDHWSLTYDSAARPVSMVDAFDRLTTYDRNPDGTLAARTLNTNGTAGSADLDRWAYTYDGLNRVVTRQRSGAGPVGTVNDTFHYDQAGRLDSYNPGTGAQAIVYDPNNNRISIGGGAATTYRADNSIRAAGGNTYVYDAFGGVADDGCDTYDYDGFDRLVSTAIPLGRACNGVVGTGGATTYDYDGLDRQIRITTPAIAGLGLLNETKEIRYSGLSHDVYTEESTLPNESARYVTTSAGQAIAVTNDTPLLPTYHVLSSDGQGSTVAATTSGLLGGVACAVDPDPWGAPRRAGGAVAPNNPCRTDLQSSPNNRWYQDARRDDTTGNYQFGNRTYTPDTGTWLQPDNTRGPGAPTSLSIGTDPLVANRYSYVNGDPINLSDPSGHFIDFSSFFRGLFAAMEGPTVDEDQDLVTSDEGTIYRIAIDTANQGDISKADGNFSRDDVEAAAAGGEKLEDVVRQILADTEYAGDEEVVRALAAETQRIAANLLTEDNSWEEIDTDRPNGFMSVAHTVLDVAGFVPGVGAIADVANAALYALEGDWKNAAISLAGAAFDGATALRGALNSVDVMSDVTRVANNIGDIDRAVDGLDAAADARRAVENATPRLPDTPNACKVNSFAPDTEVLMADGSIRPISLIAVGDIVLATDPETGEQGPREVTDIIVGDGAKELVDITIDGDTITATRGHPFWVTDDGAWVDADQLVAGDRLLTESGAIERVDRVEHRTAGLRVHNLTVDGIHTYHVNVGAGAGVLVHNCGGELVPGPNNALRDTSTGRFAPNPNASRRVPSDGVHANSLASTKPNWLYRLTDTATGEHLKFGVTSAANPLRRYSTKQLEGVTLTPIARGSREYVVGLERQLVSSIPGRLNRERWSAAL